MTIVIDPNLSRIDLLELKNYFKKNKKEKIITLFSLMQYETLKNNISNEIECKGLNLSINERKEYGKIFLYLDKLERLNVANVEIWPNKFSYSYHINVVKFYRHYFNGLGVTFWSIHRIILNILLKERTNCIIAIGNTPVFFSALTSSLLGKGITLQKIYLKQKKKNQLLPYKRYIRAICDEIFTYFYRKDKKKKTVYLGKSRQTIPWVSCIKKQTNIKFFFSPYSRLEKILMFHNNQKDIIEAIDKIDKKLIDIFSRYPIKSNFFNPEMLKNFVISLKYYNEDIKKSVTEGFFVWKNLDRIKPDIVICINWTGILDQFFKNWSKANKKPFVVLQHGIHSGGIISNTERIIDADVFLCWGKEMEKSFIDSYSDNKNVIKITGNPLYDKIFLEPRNKLEKKILKQKIKHSYKILIALSAKNILFQDYEYFYWKEIEYAVSRHPEINWYIKFHSHSICKDYVKSKFKKLGVIFVEEGSIFTAIKDCHLVITSVSTVALDAMVMQKPVIIFNLEKSKEKFSKYNAGIIIKNKGTFYARFLELLNKNFNDPELIKNQKMFVNAFNSPDAINKIINLIKKYKNIEYH